MGIDKAEGKEKSTIRKKFFYKKLNNFFDHIYLITLKKSVDHHNLIHECLEGLDYETFWGVDRKNLDLNHLQEKKFILS